MEINVGEYIRTNRGTIAKIEIEDVEWDILYRIEDMKPIYKHWVSEKQYYTEYIVKHSKNIIDLIEVGDYVNGYRVVDIMEDLEIGKLHLEMTCDYTNKELGDCTIYNKDIKSIVTREQFKEMEYRV